MTEQRQFPILWQGSREHMANLERLGCPRSIPWVAIAPHGPQAMRNHGGQDLERLAERGGLDPREAVAVLADSSYRHVEGLTLGMAVLILERAARDPEWAAGKRPER